MEFSTKNHTVVISQLPNEASDLSEQLLKHKEQWYDYNVILVAQDCTLTAPSITQAIESVVESRQSKAKSFVLVDSVERLGQYAEELSAAPTLEEAFDLIEMEEIERDLGF